MTAVVRVYLVTHRRPHLLRRALASLLAQTCPHWVCELHNDAPGDDAPRDVLTALAPGDPRFTYHPHAHNWGAVATFNHAYAGGPEPFASILEDDNWWEPAFLAAALAALAEHPDASLAWANMKLWQEQPDATWRDTGRTVWATDPTTPPVIAYHAPELLQAFDALHSQGAMVFRPDNFRPTTVPPTLPLAIIEPARERAATGPLLLLTAPLAHFACTLATARDSDPAHWLQSKLLVAASFFHCVPVPAAALAQLWSRRRAQRPPDTGLFFCLALALCAPRLLRSSRPSDWTHFLFGVLRHPRRLACGLRFRREHSAAWTWFLAQTAARSATPVHATVLSKHVPR